MSISYSDGEGIGSDGKTYGPDSHTSSVGHGRHKDYGELRNLTIDG